MSPTANGDADQPPDDLEARFERLARRRLGAERLISGVRLSGGASQETYRLRVETRDKSERSFALRRAPGGRGAAAAEGRPMLEIEAALMQAAGAAGIPEPEVLWVLTPEDELGVGFVMQWLEGETLGARIVRSPELAEVRPHLARQCGEILARIHALDLDACGLRGALERMPTDRYVSQTYERYLRLGTAQPMIDYAARWLLDNLPNSSRETLVHNDFRNGNLMVGEDGVRAVLDWEIAHVGDPVRDLGWICVNSWRFGRRQLEVGGFGSIDDLLAGYREVSGIEIDRGHLRFWIVFGSFWWAIGCLGMAQHFRSGPDRSVERAAIGRRSSECQVDLVSELIPGEVELVADPETLVEPDEDGATRAPGESPDARGSEMPRIDELVAAAAGYLRGEVMPASSGRAGFLARVAANALDVVRRDLLIGPEHRRRERLRLVELLGAAGEAGPGGDEADLAGLRTRLCTALREGRIDLTDEALRRHLRTTVVNQLAIDQPRYSGFRAALAEG
ncbi:MAG: phosphotransferase family protein [Acidobacteria bacterium]|nr:MAG: phosphotransferase family protein [Acidobacteriota bacterium]REK08875.1 MAG: phosphotransferase family protein [Acidobacteriota bacterium]